MRLYVALVIACLACLSSGVASAQTAPKDHKIPLINGHAKLACAACHDKGIGQKPSKGTNCRDCHQRGHDTDFGAECVACHGAIIWISVPEGMARAVHIKTPFPLLGKHQQAPCAGCHLPTTPAKDRYRQVSFAQCASCHEDVHKGEFASKDVLTDCTQCHDNNGWDRTSFGVDAHNKGAFKLEGKHVATPCSGCHPNRATFLMGGTACLDCHDNPHGNKFSTEMVAGGCATCHDTGNWHAPKVPHPTFALTGAHAKTACARCHGKKADDAEPASYRGIPRTCEGCHADVHAGQFATAPKKACTDCHGTEAWAKTTAFDHGKTRYPLEGVHIPMSCDNCHAKTTLRDGTQSVRWRLGYFLCKDCHRTPHATSAVASSLDCRTCHAATAWKDTHAGDGTGFDHAKTGFALRGKHVSTACGECHKGAGKPVSACEGCHVDDHQGRTNGPCAECHTPVAWSATSELEQHRRTRMPLTGKHAVLECSDCHTRQSERTWSDLPTDCFACHSAAYHAVKSPRHDGDATTPALSRECSLCHVTVAWKPALVTPGGALTDDRATHDGRFRISTGSHRAVSCDGCHVDRRRTSAVRCDGCHDQAALRGQHQVAVTATAASTCLRCHPAGARR